MEEKILELRMYFFVPYNIMPIQQGIQAGHSLGKYALKYGRYDPNHIVWDFLEKFGTWIILNGGTTNDKRDFEMIPAGSLNLIGDQLEDNDIEFSHFVEPDLNDALTALCFICDERVFNRVDYPDYIDYVVAEYSLPSEESIRLRMTPQEELEKSKHYKEWVRFVGGVKNVFLRDLLKGKHKA